MNNTIILVRHGESTRNLANEFCGWVDAPMTDIGFSQARETAGRIRQNGFAIDYVFSSPLIRAMETARIIRYVNDVKLFASLDWRWKERPYGAATCRNKDFMRTYDPDFNNWHRGTGVPPLISDDFRDEECYKIHFNLSHPSPRAF